VLNVSYIRDISQISVEQYRTGSSKDGYKWNIDDVDLKENSTKKNVNASIVGWFYKEKTDNENVTLNIIIENTETHEFYSVDTSTVARQDVNRVFNEGNDKKYNYERSGFTARIPRNRLDDDDSNYNLYMLYTQKGEEPVLVNLKTTLRE